MRDAYRDEEPFVNGGINWSRRLIITRWNIRSRMLINSIQRICHRKIHPKTSISSRRRVERIDTFRRFRFSRNKTFPSFIAFFDNFKSILFILAFPTKRKRILLFTIRNLNRQLQFLAHGTL